MKYHNFCSFSRCQPFAILDQEIEVLTADAVHMVNMRHRAKFRADRSNGCGCVSIFRLFTMATVVRHIGILKVRNFN